MEEILDGLGRLPDRRRKIEQEPLIVAIIQRHHMRQNPGELNADIGHKYTMTGAAGKKRRTGASGLMVSITMLLVKWRSCCTYLIYTAVRFRHTGYAGKKQYIK